MNKGLLFILFLLFSILGYSQTISGLITDEEDNILPAVNISVLGKNLGVISETDGLYSLTIPANRSVVIGYSFIGYHIEKIRIPMLKKGQTYTLNIQLKSVSILLGDVIVTDQKSRKESFSRIKPKHVSVLPGNSGGIEAILKTLPGVSSANELSSQYSVRGGNFDENLVYVNGIEVYRPFLVRSGQQEGLSFVNTDMVGSILFSAGGFAAKYGDKMSSVLDITYKRPKETAASLQLSMLGGSGYIEGANGRLSYLIGARHKTSKYLFNAMDTKADYTPKFSDLQAFINYELNTDWQISFLGNISKNEFRRPDLSDAGEGIRPG